MFVLRGTGSEFGSVLQELFITDPYPQKMKKQDWSMIAAIALLYLLMEGIGITCPIKFLTGISCAGCGMSRAWMALLKGDLTKALQFHPLVFLPLPALTMLLFRSRMPQRLFRAGMALIITAALAVYLIRMADPTDHIVVFEPQNGAVLQILQWVCKTIGK